MADWSICGADLEGTLWPSILKVTPDLPRQNNTHDEGRQLSRRAISVNRL